MKRSRRAGSFEVANSDVPDVGLDLIETGSNSVTEMEERLKPLYSRQSLGDMAGGLYRLPSNSVLFRGIFHRAGEELHTTSDRAAWCVHEYETARRYACWKGGAQGRSVILRIVPQHDAVLLQVDLKALTDALCPSSPHAVVWQREILFPSLMLEHPGLSGTFDPRSEQAWLLPGTYQVVGVEELPPSA